MEGKKKNVQVRCLEDEHRKWTAQATAEGRSLNNLIVMATNIYVAHLAQQARIAEAKKVASLEEL